MLGPAQSLAQLNEPGSVDRSVIAAVARVTSDIVQPPAQLRRQSSGELRLAVKGREGTLKERLRVWTHGLLQRWWPSSGRRRSRPSHRSRTPLLVWPLGSDQQVPWRSHL